MAVIGISPVCKWLQWCWEGLVTSRKSLIPSVPCLSDICYMWSTIGSKAWASGHSEFPRGSWSKGESYIQHRLDSAGTNLQRVKAKMTLRWILQPVHMTLHLSPWPWASCRTYFGWPVMLDCYVACILICMTQVTWQDYNLILAWKCAGNFLISKSPNLSKPCPYQRQMIPTFYGHRETQVGYYNNSYIIINTMMYTQAFNNIWHMKGLYYNLIQPVITSTLLDKY